MKPHNHQDAPKNRRTSRRGFIKKAALTGVASGFLGFPAVMRAHAAAPLKVKIQTAWASGNLGYLKFQDLCQSIAEVTEGKILFEGYQAGTVVETTRLFEAVKSGILDAMHCFDGYWTGIMPEATFLTSYPFGLDRPDQWETWHYELGGNAIAQEAYGRYNMHYIGPIQHGDNLIHSRLPLQSFEDFMGKRIRFPSGIIADIFRSAGVSTALLPSAEIYPALSKGDIDATDYVGAAINYELGLGEIAKFIIMGPPSTPCLHQAVDLMSIAFNLHTWRRIPSHFQKLITMAVRKHSYDQYAAIQAADMIALAKMQQDQGVQIIRLTDHDVAKFKRFAPPVWLKYAQQSALAMRAFKSQLELMKSAKLRYISVYDLVDLDGKPLIF